MKRTKFPKKKKDDSFLWNQFCRLGEMIGDGLHYEEPWISREYKKLSYILIPELKQEEAKKRKLKNTKINSQIKNLLENKLCDCGSKLMHVRSGSLKIKCTQCNLRYTAKYAKNSK